MAHNEFWDSYITWILLTIVCLCMLWVTCVLLVWAVTLVVLVMSVVVIPVFLLFSFWWMGLGGFACCFVSVILIAKAITETKQQADPLSHIHRKLKRKKTEKTTTEITRTTRTTAQRSSTRVTANINMYTMVSRNHVICESQNTLWAIWYTKCAQAYFK